VLDMLSTAGMSRISQPKEEPTPPKVIDFTHRTWGHNFTVHQNDGKTVKGSMWLEGRPKVGDILLVERVSGKVGRLRLIEVEWCVDPHDMYHFTAQKAE
jgi:hypothetical protein